MKKVKNTHTPLQMFVGNEIKKIRKKKGVTQNELSKQSGISQTLISDIENNKCTPSITSLKKISDTLDIPLPLILISSVDEAKFSPEKQELWDTFKELIIDQFSVKE